MRRWLVLAAVILALSGGTFAQTVPPVTKKKPATHKKVDVLPAPSSTPPVDKTDSTKYDSPEEAAIMPVYNNFLKEYRLGPNDVISIEVFGQCPDYCKTAITVPPTAKISYPLIREGVMVGGKTVEQVADEVTKKLDEYIIDPKVTVTLDKAMSARYSVMGNVNTPGVRVLDRKVSVFEAIVESGGVNKDANEKNVVIFSYNGGNRITSKTINLIDLKQGKIDMVFLNPGDQVFVSGKGFTLSKLLDVISRLSAFRGAVGIPL